MEDSPGEGEKRWEEREGEGREGEGRKGGRMGERDGQGRRERGMEREVRREGWRRKEGERDG